MNSKHTVLIIVPMICLVAWFMESWLSDSECPTVASHNSSLATPALEGIVSLGDGDGDGFPDACELDAEQDRRNFRRWFVTIAESQLYVEDPAWRDDDHDCAGFIRFAYREALKRHDTAWLQTKPFLLDPAIADIRKYKYPAVPLLKNRIFRTRDGAFAEGDLNDTTFAVTATAARLRSYNASYLGKSLAVLQPGDLLFYLNTGDAHMPYHSMIFVGDSRRPPSANDFVIYHTGPGDEAAGRLKKVRLADLMQHPDERWHPVPENRYFLGYYRWKILE